MPSHTLPSHPANPLKHFLTLPPILLTLLLLPLWTLSYLFSHLLPHARLRPRVSWSLRQVLFVNFTRRMHRAALATGVAWGTRDPMRAPQGKLRETRFEWVAALDGRWRAGVVCGGVEFRRVGVYVWPKELRKGEGDLVDVDVEAAAAVAVVPPRIGIFLHGGGYVHMSAHESSRTSRIPRRLIKDGLFSEIYAVEYRLLQHAPFPAVLQDAAAVYVHVLARYESTGCRIVLIGDSSGGNLALALARWVRDEGAMRMPDGLLLLSPSCDASHAFPDPPSSYVPRPNAATDYLVDTPEPRALLHRAFLGFAPTASNLDGRTTRQEEQEQEQEERRFMEIVHSEYVSPASPRVLERWGHVVAQNEEPYYTCDIALPPKAVLSLPPITTTLPLTTLTSPTIHIPAITATSTTTAHAHRGLFSTFPRTLIVVGDAERLVREVASLVRAMERDGVEVRAEWVRDAVHDVLIVREGWWDERVRERVWGVVGDWVWGFGAG